jgi:hypothetical protein
MLNYADGCGLLGASSNAPFHPSAAAAYIELKHAIALSKPLTTFVFLALYTRVQLSSGLGRKKKITPPPMKKTITPLLLLLLLLLLPLLM